MPKFDKKTLRPSKGKAKDPYRYPNVSEKIERDSEKEFEQQMNKMRVDLTKKMTEILKHG